MLASTQSSPLGAVVTSVASLWRTLALLPKTSDMLRGLAVVTTVSAEKDRHGERKSVRRVDIVTPSRSVMKCKPRQGLGLSTSSNFRNVVVAGAGRALIARRLGGSRRPVLCLRTCTLRLTRSLSLGYHYFVVIALPYIGLSVVET